MRHFAVCFLLTCSGFAPALANAATSDVGRSQKPAEAHQGFFTHDVHHGDGAKLAPATVRALAAYKRMRGQLARQGAHGVVAADDYSNPGAFHLHDIHHHLAGGWLGVEFIAELAGLKSPIKTQSELAIAVQTVRDRFPNYPALHRALDRAPQTFESQQRVAARLAELRSLSPQERETRLRATLEGMVTLHPATR